MNAHKIWILLLFFLGVESISAQEPAFHVKKFDDIPELSNAIVTDLLQDRNGFIWIGTNLGLLRFDGHVFKAFRHFDGDSTTLSSNHILCIEEDAEGNILIGTSRSGASRYDCRTGRFQNFPFTLQFDPSTTPTTGVFSDKNGQFWASAAENGVVRLDSKTGQFERFDIVTSQSMPHLSGTPTAWMNQAYHFWQDPATNKIWLSTRNSFYLLDPKTGRIEPHQDPTKKGNDTQRLNNWSIHQDNDLLWTGGWESGLQSVNIKTGEQQQFLYHPNPPTDKTTNVINAIAYKNEDELWVATGDRGLGVFNKKTKQFRFFDEKTGPSLGLSKGLARHLIRDRQGHLWFELEGVLTQIFFDTDQFHVQKLNKSGNDLAIAQMNEDREGRFLFVVTNGKEGLKVLEKKTGRETWLKPHDGLGQKDIQYMLSVKQAPDGRIWVLTQSTVLLFNPIEMRLEKPAQPSVIEKSGVSTNYTEFAIDPRGRLWLGTSRLGVICYDPSTGQSRHFMPDPNDPKSIPTNVVGVIEVDAKGRCWFGSRDKTAYGYFLESENRFVRLDSKGIETQAPASHRTNSISTDQNGNIWVCAETGMIQFDSRGERPILVKKFNLSTGLPSDYIVRADADSKGNIWALTSHSIFCLHQTTGQVRNFGKRDGFTFSAPHDVYAAQDGSIYAFGSGSYARFDPEALKTAKVSVPLALTSFRVDDRETYLGSLHIPEDVLVVPAGSKYFSLEFAALDLTNPTIFEYEYYFEGFENQWIKSGSRRLLSFMNIPAGRYNFKIKLEGAPDEEAISIPILVKVSFYKTGWFWALVLSVIAATAFRYYQGRQRQNQLLQALKGKAQLLEKEKAVVMYESLKQQLNPHFLFNSLTSLNSLIQINPKMAATFLDSLSKTYRYILKSSDHETVPLSDEIKFAQNYTSLQKTRFELGFEVNINIPEELQHHKIVPVTLQNLIENAIKHNIIDEEMPLVIDIYTDKHYLIVRNSIQRKTYVETSNKQGLTNLRTLYSYLNDQPVTIAEVDGFFVVKLPLL